MELDDRVGLDATDLADLRAAVTGQQTLADVVLWGLAHRPPRMVEDVVVQDEYTHDVVLGYRGGLYLVYDAT